MPSIARIGKNLFLALLAGVSTLLVAEGAFRYWERPAWYEALHSEGPLPEKVYRKNSIGLRGPDLAPDSKNSSRVLFLGDSFTYGFGMPDESKIFVSVLERMVNEEMGAKRHEFVNAGISGSLTADWVEEYGRLAPVVRPEMVIAVFFLRDGTDLRFASQFYRMIYRDIVLRNRLSSLYQMSAIYRYFRRIQDTNLIASRYEKKFIDSYFGDEKQTAEWRNAQKNILTIRDRAEKSGSKFALVVFPVLSDLGGNYRFRKVVEEVENFAKGNGIPAHSLLPDFLGKDPASLWVSSSDQHPNGKAHAIAAESIYPFLMELRNL
jgi:lysophospholipase L1-like esterase